MLEDSESACVMHAGVALALSMSGVSGDEL